MTAGTWTLTNSSRTKILDGTLSTSATYKVALFTTAAASATSTVYSGLSNEVGTTNTGYTTTGASVTPSLSGTTSVTWSFASDPTWTAGSAGLAAIQAVLYDTVSGYILAYCLLDSGGATVTTTSGQTLTIDSDGSPGPVLTFS
ncbi:MAG TPA: hypothetical protein VFQ37_00810 [Mycobacterium sp.]|nr:hypothetical protein [Mycobacterium sp.]